VRPLSLLPQWVDHIYTEKHSCPPFAFKSKTKITKNQKIKPTPPSPFKSKKSSKSEIKPMPHFAFKSKKNNKKLVVSKKKQKV
jgi:hypothetical protein